VSTKRIVKEKVAIAKGKRTGVGALLANKLMDVEVVGFNLRATAVPADDTLRGIHLR